MTDQQVQARFEIVTDFRPGNYCFLYRTKREAPGEIPRSKIEVPFHDRRRRAEKAVELAWREAEAMTVHGTIRSSVFAAVGDLWQRAHEIRPRVSLPMPHGLLSTVLYQLAKRGAIDRDDRVVYCKKGFPGLKPFYRRVRKQAAA